MPCGPSTLTRSIVPPPCRYHSPHCHDWSTLPPSAVTPASHARRSVAPEDRCHPRAVPPGDHNLLISPSTPVDGQKARTCRDAVHFLVRRAQDTRSFGNLLKLPYVMEYAHVDYPPYTIEPICEQFRALLLRRKVDRASPGVFGQENGEVLPRRPSSVRFEPRMIFVRIVCSLGGAR